MARGVNKVILVGNVGGDPETRYLPNGNAVTNITLATSDSWKDKQTGQLQERTEWHRVVFFGKVAEIAGEYLRKGSQCYIEGRISYSETTGDDGQKRYFTDIIADEMQMLGGGDGQRGGEGGGGGGYQRGGGGGGGYGGDRPQRQPAQRREPAQAKPANFDDVPFDDDIPF